MAVHELFDTIARLAGGYADLFAEHAAALGGVAEGTLQVAAAQSILVPYPLRIADEKLHLFAVAAALAAFGESTRAAVGQCDEHGDPESEDIFTEVTRGIDRQLWYVESHLEPRTRK